MLTNGASHRISDQTEDEREFVSLRVDSWPQFLFIRSARFRQNCGSASVEKTEHTCQKRNMKGRPASSSLFAKFEITNSKEASYEYCQVCGHGCSQSNYCNCRFERARPVRKPIASQNKSRKHLRFFPRIERQSRAGL